MFEVNPSRKINKSENVKSDNNTVQQRAFLNEPQDTLELSTKKKKKSISFGAAIKDIIKTFRNYDEEPISPKAVKMLKDNGIVGDDFKPEWSIMSNSDKKLTDMPVVFQRKLAIDMVKGKPNSQEDVYQRIGSAYAQVIYNDEGKPSKITYFGANEYDVKYSEEFEYAHKQDGSPVLVKQSIYKHRNKDERILDEEITFHKHHNGAVTISSTDGRTMSYSLRKETIRNYNNTPKQIELPTQQTQTQGQNNQQTSLDGSGKKIFVPPNPVYPKREYTASQLYKINDKFDRLEKEFMKGKDPNADDAFLNTTSVVEGLHQIKQLVLDCKDPIIQDKIIQQLAELKDYDLPVNRAGIYNRIDVLDYNSKFNTIYRLAKLSAIIDNGAVSLNAENEIESNLEKKFPYTYNNVHCINWEDLRNANSQVELIMFDTSLTKAERYAQAQGVVHDLRMELLSSAIDDIAYKMPDIKDYLSRTYLKPNIPEEFHSDLDALEKSIGEVIIPRKHSNFTYETLNNFHNLNDCAKQHFLKHPDMCTRKYLHTENYFGVEKPYDVLAGMSEDDWKIFEKRNLADVIDIITGYNISSFEEKTGTNLRKVLNMPDEKWKKINDFELLTLGIRGDELSFEKHRNIQFNFDQSLEIVDNLSYEDWETAKRRGLLNMKSELCDSITNYNKNISTSVLISATKVPDSTFNFLKNKIELFKDNKLDITSFRDDSFDNIASGINFLAKSHNDVYENVTRLCNNGFHPSIVMEMVGICSNNYDRFGKYVTGKALELKDKGLKDYEVRNILAMYIDLQSIQGKLDINELSIDEKRTLLKNLIKYNAQLFDKNYENLFDSPIVPKNKDEYCAILPKLVKSIGIDVRPVTQETIDNFVSATNSMADKNSEFMNTKFTKHEPKLELEYPRDQFITNVLEKVSTLSDTEKMKVYDYFGFDLKPNKDNILQMHGYPINVNNGSKLSAIQDENTRAVVEEVRPLVEKFSNDNKVSIEGKPELSQQINDILELFPEFRSTIGKEQHDTHDFTVDIHTLKVLQGVMSDPRYEKLSDEDKKILNIATLLHDLTKAEKTVDKTHPSYSAYDAYHIVSKMNMPEKDKIRIYQIIKNHDWLEQYNGKVKIGPNEYREHTPQEKDKIAKDIAFELKDGNNFELANILTKADMKAVKASDEFFNRFENAFYKATSVIEPLVENIQQTAIHLPQTKIPKASELKVDGDKVQEETFRTKDGTELKYKRINLEPDMDLGALGFEQGLNSNDLNVIVHALDEDTQSATFQALGSVDSDSLLSSSYVNYAKGNYHVFRQQGFILDVNSADIQAGTYKDFGSGYGKDLETLKGEYLFNGERKSIRNFMSDNMKKRLNLSDKEYQKLYPEIADKSITELDKSHPKIAKAMREMFMEMEVHKRRHGRDYNEWLVSRPKIQGVFIQSSKYKYDNPPEFLIKYAVDNDLPVIYFGE